MTIEITDRQRDILLGELEDRLWRHREKLLKYQTRLKEARGTCNEHLIEQMERFIENSRSNICDVEKLIKQLEQEGGEDEN